MSNSYQPLPTSPPTDSQTDSRSIDPRFNPKPVAAWKRVLLVAFIVFLMVLGYKIRAWGLEMAKKEPEIVHADRYSHEFKYRPAASPIITKRLKDGRLEVRGDYHAAGMRRKREL